MKVKIWQRGGSVGTKGPLKLYAIAQSGIGNFQIEIVYEIKVYEERKVANNLSEYRILIERTGDINISDIAELSKIKTLVTTAQSLYYDVPNQLLMIPIIASLFIFATGVAVGKKLQKRR